MNKSKTKPKTKRAKSVNVNKKIVKVLMNLVVSKDTKAPELAKLIHETVLSNPQIIDFVLVSEEHYPVSNPLNTKKTENSILC